MFLLGFRKKMTALTLYKSIESAIQWFQIHHRYTFATVPNSAVYLSGARVSIFPTLVPQLSAAVIVNMAVQRSVIALNFVIIIWWWHIAFVEVRLWTLAWRWHIILPL